MLLADSPIPELQTLSRAQYDLVEYALAGAGFALLAYTLYSWTSRGEVGVRYRPAVLAGLCIGAVATVSYLLLFLRWGSGFDLTDAGYVPNDRARLALSPRYVDWSVTVPLLTAELLAVCALAGARVRSLRASSMTAAFLMILTGHLGAQVVDEGRDTTALVVWGLVSCVFYAYLYVALIGAVRSSLPAMGREAAVSLRNATIVLLAGFGVYPLVYAIPVFVDVTAAWLTTIQLAYSAADVVAKVGFGVLVHKVAKLRTAEDVVAGVDTHPEAVWVGNVEHSRAVLPAVRSGEERATPPVVGAGDPRRAGEHR
ncbi:bacteriorhodopsin [Modestobacter sp. VKM Ac-2986]|uniref:bacteriorhodopsin n=1 Tax=Modestobacter sp. VKM Ac-2986 TaxID=3004140 RepID=UPI0022AB315F|nr:bacteriorhodopsin [Modestobacter sp. VKM Ac-2986]MCZ2827338.1 bacteriorhodopsin [Modestobacter sp. VKM Ac-2986]